MKTSYNLEAWIQNMHVTVLGISSPWCVCLRGGRREGRGQAEGDGKSFKELDENKRK